MNGLSSRTRAARTRASCLVCLVCLVALVVVTASCTKKQPGAAPSGGTAASGGTEGPSAGSGEAGTPGATTVTPQVGYTVEEVTGGGTLEVVAKYLGEEIPTPAAVEVNINVEHCGGKVVDQSLLVDADTRGLRNVIVRLEGIRAGKEPPAELIVNNQLCSFEPHVQVAVAKQRGFKGTKVVPKNLDPFLHTTAATLNGVQLFNAPLPDPSASYPGKAAGQTGLMELRCDVHKWMHAYVYVHSNPYLGVTDAQGKLAIEEIPAGTYPWVAWHEKLGELRGEIEIPAGGTAQLTIELGE